MNTIFRRFRFLGFAVAAFLLCMAATGLAWAGHAPVIFYNVPNWYSSGWDQIRYQTPYDAFAVEWDARVPNCQTGGKFGVLQSVEVDHVDGYEDGDLYLAREAAYNYDCTFFQNNYYVALARRFVNCGDPNSSAYSASSLPGGRCPDGMPDRDKNRGKPKCPVCAVGDPINPSSANKFELLDLFKGQGAFPVTFTLAYNGGQSAPILSPVQLSLGHAACIATRCA